MIELFDEIAKWFIGFGIHPVLGAFVAGVLVALVVRSRRSAPAAVEGFRGAELATEAARTSGMFQKSVVALEHQGASLTIDGRTLQVEPGLIHAVAGHIRSGHTVDAIKLVREKTGLGLSESKQLVDTLASSPLMR